MAQIVLQYVDVLADTKKIAEDYISQHPEVSENDFIIVKPKGGERYDFGYRMKIKNKVYKVIKNESGVLSAEQMGGNNKKRKSIRRKSNNRKSKSINRRKRTTRRK